MHKTFCRIERTSPDKERIRRTRNGQETHANGDERSDNFALRRTSVNAIRQGVTAASAPVTYKYMYSFIFEFFSALIMCCRQLSVVD